MSPPAYDVCVVTTIHPDFDKRVYRQIAGLTDTGLKICAVAPWDFSQRNRTDYDFRQLAPARSRRARVAHAWRTYKAARAVPARAYIFHDPDFLPFALRLQRVTGCPVIYDSHENMPEEIRYGKAWIPAPLRLPLSTLFRAFENFAVRRLGRTITTVPNLTERFRALGADAVEVRNYPRLTVPAGHACEPGILYTGTISRDFGAEALLRIAAKLKESEVNLPMRAVDVFQGDQAMRAKFLRRIEVERLPIELLPPVPSHHMAQLLCRGHIGLSPVVNLPNRALALPSKIFEFYQFGLAVIASDVAGSRIATENGALGLLVAHDDYRGWVHAIKRLQKDGDFWLKLTNAARAASNTRYTWRVEQGKLLEYVTRVTERAAAGQCA